MSRALCPGKHTLKHNLQRKLQLPWRTICSGDFARAGVQSRTGKDRRVRVLERRMIQNVERLRPELHLEGLRDLRHPEFFCQRVVQIPEVRTDNGVASRIAVRALRLQREAARVEPRAQCMQA